MKKNLRRGLVSARRRRQPHSPRSGGGLLEEGNQIRPILGFLHKEKEKKVSFNPANHLPLHIC
jgi:hypothetical protein